MSLAVHAHRAPKDRLSSVFLFAFFSSSLQHMREAHVECMFDSVFGDLIRIVRHACWHVLLLNCSEADIRDEGTQALAWARQLIEC